MGAVKLEVLQVWKVASTTVPGSKAPVALFLGYWVHVEAVVTHAVADHFQELRQVGLRPSKRNLSKRTGRFREAVTCRSEAVVPSKAENKNLDWEEEKDQWS